MNLDRNNFNDARINIGESEQLYEIEEINRREKWDQNLKENKLSGNALNIQKYNNAENQNLGDKNVQLERTEDEEENRKRKKKRKKKKWNKLITKGSVSSFEGPRLSRRDSEHLRKLKHHFVSDDNYNDNESRSRLFDEKSESHDAVENEYTNDRTLYDKPRKKKKKILDLKKTSSKVGIVNQDALPPIQADTVDDSTNEHTHERNEPSIPSNTGDVLSGSTSSLISSAKDSTSTNFQKPLRFCVWITRFPLISFFIVSLGHLATFAVTTGLLASGYDVFPLEFKELPLLIMNDARLKDLAWRAKDNYDGFVYRPVYGRSVPTWYRGRVKDIVEVTLEKPGGNVLTTQNLRLIQLAEERLFNLQSYQEDFCTVDYYDNCIKPKSILRFFDGTYSHIDPVFNDDNFTNINKVMYIADYYNETKEELLLFLGKDSVINQNHSHTAITRILFPMGWPLGKLSSGYYGGKHDLEDFLVNEFKPEIEAVRDNLLVDHLGVYYLSKMMLEHDVIEQAMSDLKLAIGSCLFIFLFMCFQTGSVTVTFLGILSVLSSFLLTNLIYRYVFQFIYFGFFHVIAIFLILGIGADDLFVFYDTWRLTGNKNYPSDAHRLSDCYRKAAKTTLVTSCTTMMAFLVSGLSPLLPVRTFGLFSGLLVAINYIWVIVYFPTIIMLHHAKVKGVWYRVHALFLRICISENIRRPLSRQNSTSSIHTITGKVIDSYSANISIVTNTRGDNLGPISVENEQMNKQNVYTLNDHELNAKVVLSPKILSPSQKHVKKHLVKDSVVFTPNKTGINADIVNFPRSNHKTDSVTNPSKPKKHFEDRNRVVLCLKNGFFDLISKRSIKVLILAVFLGVTIFFIHRATKLEPDTHQLRLYRETHNYAKATMKHYFSFRRNDEDEYTRLYLVWGMQAADISDCDLKSAEFCRGTPVYDETFYINTLEAQTAFKELCDRLENMDAKLADELRIRRDIASGKLAISCFVKPLENYFKARTQTSYGLQKYGSSLSLELPISPNNITHFMDRNTFIYRNSMTSNFTNHFEILMSYWLTNAYTLQATEDYFKYNELVGEKKIDGVTEYAYYHYSGLYYGTKLQYLAIEVNTTMNVYSVGYQEGMPVYFKWEELVNDMNKRLPPGVNGAFQMTENLWHWLHVQETLANSAVTGILVGLFSAWLILILMTFNYVIGTLAVIVIALVTACVVGMIPLAGWRLGVLESLNLCMVVGLSVDYVVHLAEAYRMSTAYRRHDKVKDMLQSMGLSVISGALTTIGAAVFMLFAQIQFFFQFGIFIISTIGTSLTFSLLGFTTFMSLCGPQGETGSLMKAARECKLCVCGNQAKRVKSGKMKPEETKRIWDRFSPCSLVERIFDQISYGK